MNSRRQGFTLIELLMAILASSLLAVIVGLMLVTTFRVWFSNRQYVALQRDASLAQTVVDRWVREASPWEVSATNGSLTIVTSTGTKRLYRDANSLVFDPDTASSGDELVLSSNRVTTYEVEAVPLGVTVDLLLEDDTTSVELHTFLSHRN